MGRDEEVVAAQALLSSMGVENYDAGVVGVVIEQMHRSIQALLSQARELALHSGRSQVTLKDLQLTDDFAQEDNYASSPSPSRESLFQLARVINSQPITLNRNGGTSLPANEVLDHRPFDIFPSDS